MNIANNFYYDWPLIVLIGNCYEPQWVEDVLARVRELDQRNKVFPDSALMVVMGYMVIMARDGMEKN